MSTHDFLQRPGSSRPQRVADQIQKELARLVQFEVKDPRLGMVTITGVEVARDFGYADIWYSVLKGEPTKCQQALESASGFLRTQVGRAIKLRITPHLRFHYDETPRRGVEMSALIDKARASDRELTGESAEEARPDATTDNPGKDVD